MLHEIGHILFGHHSLEGEETDGKAPVVLGRTNYTTRQEQEAEMLASMIRMRTAGNGPQSRTAPRGALARLESAMGYGRGAHDGG
ncbi:hypothetical protein [Streptomyces cirratus]|uniref:hypothetical protein n=1 Tax=Streptomyces cirratus TaxID=68187 RepID=UPI00360FD425